MWTTNKCNNHADRDIGTLEFRQSCHYLLYFWWMGLLLNYIPKGLIPETVTHNLQSIFLSEKPLCKPLRICTMLHFEWTESNILYVSIFRWARASYYVTYVVECLPATSPSIDHPLGPCNMTQFQLLELLDQLSETTTTQKKQKKS